MEAVTYYNSITGEAVCEPFPKRNFVIPKGFQLTKPVIPQTIEGVKTGAYAKYIADSKAGVTTSVRGIVMQCGERDVTMLSLSNLKDRVRDVNDAWHNVTEVEFNQIAEDVKNGLKALMLEYWNTIDNFVA